MKRPDWLPADRDEFEAFFDWAASGLVENCRAMRRHGGVEGSTRVVHLVTPFYGADGDYVDCYATRESDGVWRLHYEWGGFTSPEAVELALVMGYHLEDGVLTARIAPEATQQEAESTLLGFLATAVTLAVALSVLPGFPTPEGETTRGAL